MARQGKYTKRVSVFTRMKRSVKRRWRWFKALSKPKKALLIGAPLLAFLILTPLITYAYYYNDIADQERLMNRNNTGIVLMDKNGETFYSTGRAEHRELLPLDEISDQTEHALIAAEDKTFYEHEGVSITGIMRALYNNILAQDVTGGGSTITQQLAKNTLLTEEQTIFRKYQELAISLAIEQRYSKDQILSMYLNSAFFGGNIFGIEDAAQKYFGKSARDLDLAESSMLIGILPAPNAYSPTFGDAEYAKQRQETVLTRMVDNGYITEAEKKAALAQELSYQEMDDQADTIAPHFSEMVLNKLYAEYGGEEKVTRSGYQVRTTLDLNLQRQLKQNIEDHLSYIEVQGGSNASGVAIDPHTGEVRALIGSANWQNKDWGKVNMVTTARQPGSSFKPIYYSQALAEGVITPATILSDVPTDFGGYSPQNASRTFSGDISVRNALARSLNIPSVEVMEKYGIDASIKAAEKLGITTLDPDKSYGLSLALGSAEVPLLEMTNAYAAFANKGEQYENTIIQQVNDKFNNNVFKVKHTGERAISSEGAFLISSILSDYNARAPIFGSTLTVPGYTTAVKTGTTDDSRDAWTIGYTPDIAVGVWVGNNDNQIMNSGGSDMAGPIWLNTMADTLSGKTDQPFEVPSGITRRAVCYSNGGLASEAGPGTYEEFFLAWRLPTETCTVQQEPKQEEKPAEQKPAADKKKPEEQEEEKTPADGNESSGNSGSDTGESGGETPSDGGNEEETGNSGGTTPLPDQPLTP